MSPRWERSASSRSVTPRPGTSTTSTTRYIGDDKFLDPTAPESLVYRVDGDQRTLVSAMYIANGVAIDDPSIVGYGGPLMQWHVHLDLCWTGGSDGPKVVGVRDADGNCPPGSVNAGGGNPMVHVWIAPNPCGPFAALEGHGAGQTTDDATRTDQCASGHDHGTDGSTTADGVATSEHDHGDAAATAVAVPYTATLPVDLSGTPGVSAEQQAFAENLVTDTLERLPQWSDPAVAEAAGFRSIGDERHRPRALHPVGLDRRRRLPRSRSPGEPRVRAAAGRVAPARVGDVHAPEVVHARRRAGLGRCADAVAHPRQPVLHRRSRRCPARRRHQRRRLVHRAARQVRRGRR